MLIRFYAAENDREAALAQALKSGAALHGDTVDIVPSDYPTWPEADIACFFGVKGASRSIYDAYRAVGRHTLMFDKALIRTPDSSARIYFRACIDHPTPVRYINRVMRSWERWERLKIRLEPRRESTRNSHIIYAGSSQKYCNFHGLCEANDYAESILRACAEKAPKRPLIYRPKPSFMNFRNIPGTRLSRPPESLPSLLNDAHAVVTHGSSAAIDAIIFGVPAIVLSPCAASSVAGSLDDLRDPPFPSDAARFHFASNLAWCQWTGREFASGEAWQFLRGEILALGASA